MLYLASCLIYITVSFASSMMKKEREFHVCLKITPFPKPQIQGYFFLQATLKASNLAAVMPEEYYLFYMPYVNKKTGNIFQKSILFPEFYGRMSLEGYKPLEDELDRDFVLDRNLVITKSQLRKLNEAIENKNYNFLGLNKDLYKGNKSEKCILQSLGIGNSVLYYNRRKQKVAFRSLKDFINNKRRQNNINNKPQKSNQWLKPLPLIGVGITGAGIFGYKKLNRPQNNKRKKSNSRHRYHKRQRMKNNIL